MRHLFVFVLSFILLHGVRAIPLEERQILDPLGSFVTSVFNIEPTPTATDSDDGPAEPTATPDPKDGDNNDDNEDEDVTTIPGPAVRTSTTESASSEPTSSSSLSSSSSSSATTTSASTTTTHSAIPTNPLTAEETPKSSKDDSGNGITPAGIAVAVIMSIAILIAVFVVVWKFHPKVVAWRKKKAYERMQERTYRPALDGSYPKNTSSEKGLGLSNVETTRPLSLFAFAAPRHQIRRKPVPPADYPTVEMPRLEKELPARPPDYARAMS